MGVNAGESSRRSKRDAEDAVVDEVKAETAALWLLVVVTGGGTATEGAKFDDDVVRDDANDDADAAGGALAGVNASNCPKSAKNGSDVGAFRAAADRVGIGDVLPLAPSELKKSKSAVKLADEDEADGTAMDGT